MHVTAEGIQRAIGVLCAGLDSTELQVWAMDELIPRDSDGLSDFLAALYVMDRVLLGELCEATGGAARGDPAAARARAEHGHEGTARPAGNPRHALNIGVS